MAERGQYVTHKSAIQDTDPSQHSPWELFDEGATPEQMHAEAPSLNRTECARLQAAVEQLMRTRKYQLFCNTPGPDGCTSLRWESCTPANSRSH